MQKSQRMTSEIWVTCLRTNGTSRKYVLYQLQTDIIAQLNRFESYIVAAQDEAEEENDNKARQLTDTLEQTIKDVAED
ncbi:hypothetical protein [Bacillus sp. T33-2]|uniref:hypothetical protein n=1 Tax=Bacillus sp. T33-2 TaxID=2054168 RepID=UPI000C76E040|nr:hypothetical protein [Bacillus sp. T33-2]PLR95924.1 hypothetical protein CVD19_12945 [Bacillus sp. T33-2]